MQKQNYFCDDFIDLINQIFSKKLEFDKSFNWNLKKF